MATSHLLGTDPVVAWMRANDIPVNRRNYIELNWGAVPRTWTPDDESELPSELQDWTIFERDGGGVRLRATPVTKAPITARLVDRFTAEWEESKHPREPKGTREGGRWSKGFNEIVHNFEEATKSRHHGSTRPPSSTAPEYEQWRQKGKPEALDRQARDAVLHLGGSEREYGVAIQKGGDLSQGAMITVLPGEKRAVKVPDDLHDRITEQGPVDFHHNHPNNTPISVSDIAFLGQKPGIVNVHAHTVEGDSTYSVSINGRTYEKPDLKWPKQMSEVLRTSFHEGSRRGWPEGALGDVRSRLVDELEKARGEIRRGTTNEETALINNTLSRIDQHAFNVATDNVGLTHYTYSLSPQDEAFFQKYGKELARQTENHTDALKLFLEMREIDPSTFTARLRIQAKDWNEDEHPRGPSAPGHSGGEFAKKEGGEAAAAEPELHPDVINVGGDQWNKDTAVRLEKEYQAVRPVLEKMAKDAEGKTVMGSVARNWDDLDGAQQEKAEQEWTKENFHNFYEGEEESWYQSERKERAEYLVAHEFNNRDARAWAMDAIQAWREQREEDGAKPLPFDDEEILDAIYIAESGGEIRFDNDKLREAAKFSRLDDSRQLTFPGVEEQDYSKLLTEQMRNEITDVLNHAWGEEASEREDKLEPPDLTDQTNDVMADHWSEMPDDTKFDYAQSRGIGGSSEEVIHLPTKYDPLNCDTSSAEEELDYQRTQALARYMSIERAADLILQRVKFEPEKAAETQIAFLTKLLNQPERLESLSKEDVQKLRDEVTQRTKELDEMRKRKVQPDAREDLIKDLERYDQDLWGAWKAASTTAKGKLLQTGVADELGGRLFTEHKEGFNPESVRKYGDQTYGDIGGYDGVKAYIRAKWETTQYLLDKAGDQRLHLYRAISKDPEALAEEPRRFLNKEGKVVGESAEWLQNPKRPGYAWEQLTDMPVKRNGAASTSVKASVSNGWDGSTGRIVLRADVPRTAVVSIPAYGINEKSEQEVVVAGTAWHSWDAWKGEAPPFDLVPMGGGAKAAA